MSRDFTSQVVRRVNSSSNLEESFQFSLGLLVLFFVAGAIVFRLVTTLEAYLRTSGESNHHR